MEHLLPVINDLQNVFKKTNGNGKDGADDIQLPQIIAVGSQSAGKSSVLESLVGKSFLPRGAGIVTRSPTILQLVQTRDDDGREWCSFPGSDDPDKLYYDFEEVRAEIENRTNLIAGNNKGISMEPITVRVHSPNIVSLTIVDLPGVVKNPVGDQPLDIEDQVLNLINDYIKNPNAIILAISPANADIATSESLKLAKVVDPKMDRTLAVVTKLDMMDKGTDATAVLFGQVIEVKLGIVGVVNRSQFDINNNKTLKTALEDEEAFLNENYPKFAGKIGSRFLANRLSQLLLHHIQDNLPDLIARILSQTEKYEAQRESLGQEIACGDHEKIYLMMEIVNNFYQEYKLTIKSRSSDDRHEWEEDINFTSEITAAYDKFNQELEDLSLPDLGKKIQKEIRRSENIERFISIEDVFKNVVKQQLVLLEKPSMECAEAVHAVLSKAVEHCLKDKRLGYLNSEICRITRKLLNSQLKETKISIKEHFKIQTGMICSKDPDFLKFMQVARKTTYVDDKNTDSADVHEELEAFTYNRTDITDPDEHRFVDMGRLKQIRVPKAHTHKSSSKQKTSAAFPLETSVNQKDNVQVDYIQNLVLQYFSVVRKQIGDYMPKSVIYHLFDCTLEKLQNTIRKALAGKEKELISEPEAVVYKRQETDEMLKNLHEAAEIVGGIQSKH